MLKAKDIYAFIESKLKNGLSVRYLSDIIVLFKSIFRYASREYRIRNVLDGIILPKKNKPEIAMLDKAQQLRLESLFSIFTLSKKSSIIEEKQAVVKNEKRISE